MEKKNINILFLYGGDGKYHKFDEVNEIYKHFLINAGFKITITDDLDMLRPENLNVFDVIINTTTNQYIPEEKEAGLMEGIIGNPWAKTGTPKGFIGLHGATCTFLHSKQYLQMIGARLLTHPYIQKHKYYVDDKSHPIMNGVNDFELESELYLMEIYPPFETLLSSNYLGFKRPIAWYKPYGRGRVFYCALGHDTNEVANTNFQQMVINAVKWSVFPGDE